MHRAIAMVLCPIHGALAMGLCPMHTAIAKVYASCIEQLQWTCVPYIEQL
jgi:hypothetical protein